MSRYLAVYGDRYNGFPSLYYQLPSAPSEAWLRFTVRTDVPHFIGGKPLIMGFEESVTDVYFAGTPAENNWSFVTSIQVDMANGTGLSWRAHIENNSNVVWSGSASGGNALGTQPVVDLHVKRTASYTGPSPHFVAGGVWLIEVYVNGAIRWSGSDSVFGDFVVSGTFAGAHPMGAGGVKSINIFEQYGNYVSPNILAFDDISAGTTQGGTDLLPVQTFEDGTYGLFTDPSFDSPTTPTFEVLPPLSHHIDAEF